MLKNNNQMDQNNNYCSTCSLACWIGLTLHTLLLIATDVDDNYRASYFHLFLGVWNLQ